MVRGLHSKRAARLSGRSGINITINIVVVIISIILIVLLGRFFFGDFLFLYFFPGTNAHNMV